MHHQKATISVKSGHAQADIRRVEELTPEEIALRDPNDAGNNPFAGRKNRLQTDVLPTTRVLATTAIHVPRPARALQIRAATALQ